MNRDDLLTEKVWQSEVIALAKTFGWQVFHAMPAMNARGRWATHQMGDTGFPDLMLAHTRYGAIFAELKTNKGRLTVNQQEWLDVLHTAGCETHVWRPKDRHNIKLRLMGDQHAA